MDTTIAPDTAAPAPSPEPTETPVLSIMDHARTYGPDTATPDPEAPAGETTAEKAERLHHASLQTRNPSGQFDGKPRIKAKDAVGRINELTGRAKTAEERVTALERELQQNRSGPASASPAPARPAVSPDASPRPAAPSTQAQAPQPHEPRGALQPVPEPDEADPKYGGDYGKYMRDVSKWEAREALRQHQQDFIRAVTLSKQQAQQDASRDAFGQRIEAAKQKYPDFEQVAFAPTRIPKDGAIDSFIIEDDNGVEVLYHLLRPEHQQEYESLLQMEHEVSRGGSAVKLLRRLSLLSQRFDSPPSRSAGVTGSAPPRITSPPLRPPNPVRTEASRAASGPPPTDGTLSVLAHAKQFQRR